MIALNFRVAGEQEKKKKKKKLFLFIYFNACPEFNVLMFAKHSGFRREIERAKMIVKALKWNLC